MNLDFTLSIYRKLLISIIESGYKFITFEEWCNKKAINNKVVILRHDVDLKAENSLETAKIEASLGIKATYYFRVVPQSNKPVIIKEIANLNHEIGYHYEDLSLFDGDKDKAIQHFNNQLTYFRTFYPVKTVCMHGSPTSRFDNRDIWNFVNYREFGIVGEPYFDFLNLTDKIYFTDTARMWDGDRFNVRDKSLNTSGLNSTEIKLHSTFDLINWIKSSGNQLPIMITTHPQRWTNNIVMWYYEFIAQNIKNQLKLILIKKRK